MVSAEEFQKRLHTLHEERERYRLALMAQVLLKSNLQDCRGLNLNELLRATPSMLVDGLPLMPKEVVAGAPLVSKIEEQRLNFLEQKQHDTGLTKDEEDELDALQLKEQRAARKAKSSTKGVLLCLGTLAAATIGTGAASYFIQKAKDAVLRTLDFQLMSKVERKAVGAALAEEWVAKQGMKIPIPLTPTSLSEQKTPIYREITELPLQIHVDSNGQHWYIPNALLNNVWVDIGLKSYTLAQVVEVAQRSPTETREIPTGTGLGTASALYRSAETFTHMRKDVRAPPPEDITQRLKWATGIVSMVAPSQDTAALAVNPEMIQYVGIIDEEGKFLPSELPQGRKKDVLLRNYIQLGRPT